MSMFNKIVEYASRQLEIPAEEITRDTTFESLGVDSLDIVEMTMAVEGEFGLEDMDEEDLSGISTVAIWSATSKSKLED